MKAPLPKVTGRSTRQRKLDRDKEAAVFRDAVWIRDGGRNRVTGLPLERGTAYRSNLRGEVCHLKGRRVMPEWKTDPKRAILMSGYHHALSDHRGGCLLKLTDPITEEPAINGDKPIRFTLYHRDGSVKWTTVG